MSDDLPARLRSAAEGDDDMPWWWDAEERGGPAAILREAADEIERLKADNPGIPDHALRFYFNVPAGLEPDIQVRALLREVTRMALGNLTSTQQQMVRQILLDEAERLAEGGAT